jgi:DNA-binding winged helix-turn-helix (wHTH) protein
MPPLQTNSIYEFGGFSLDIANQLLLHAQRPVDLTGKELKMLAFLVEHHDRVVGSEELVLAVWGPEGSRYLRNLSHHIARIRKVLGCDARVPKFIKTFHWKKGYRFIAPVNVVESVSGAAPILPSSEPGAAVFEVRSHFFVPMFFGAELYSHLRVRVKTNEGIEYKEFQSERGVLHLLASGFGVWHIAESKRFEHLWEFADWRRKLYREILEDRQLLKIATDALLTSMKRKAPLIRIIGKPGYVFSAHVLKSTTFRNQQTVRRAIQVLASPSLLETNSAGIQQKGDRDALERNILEDATLENHLEVFGLLTIDLGYASWDSVSYLHRSGVNLEQRIVDFEIAVQSLWWMCKCATEVFLSGEADEVEAVSKFVPEIKRQFTKLKSISATESRSQRTMKEAILKTSRLKQMVEEVVDLHKESNN